MVALFTPWRTRELIFTASEQYVQNYEQRHGILKVLGMRDPVKLESVYTAVQFLDNDARSSLESIESLEQFYRQANSRRFQFQDKEKQAKTGEKCWELLEKLENSAAKELAHTPLLLTFLCLVYDHSQNFPDNRSVLYRKALRILLEEWASEKRINREKIYQGLHTELEEILLSKIAYINFESDRLFCSGRDIVGQIKTFLASNLNAPQQLDGEAVLNAIAVQQGILVERADDVFSFSHLTLQEYLTAQYIDDNRLVEKLVTEHLIDKRWKEVFLLVAGLMRGGADDLLLRMEKEAQKYINTPKLQALLKWAEQITSGSPGDYKPVGKRAVAISYANANANAEAIEYTRKLEELKIFNNVNFTMLIDQLKELKDKIPDDKQPQEVHRTFLQRLQQTLRNAFNLSPDIINLSQEEAKALENYLYANNLLIQCKQASVLVSRTTWEEIEARMLLVPGN
ncbi:NACHT domain-containing protein [Nostoc sp.]|uniref:NACHT domain-containing protein n=1 Tax=Nostoc sp. TaxID=1180 RepID=UPI002FF654A6